MDKTTRTDINSDITFKEFVELCEEAGISTDNLEQMEQDFRSGKALADVTDALITSSEDHPDKYSFEENEKAMDEGIMALDPDKTPMHNREMALKIAVHALRFLAEHCHDEGQN